MIEAFEKYVRDYDLTIPEIRSKYNLSYRVMGLCREYAKKLNFSKEDIELATLIGLLHDLGRFEQFRRYHSYVDRETMDHADYSVVELFDKGLISKFTRRKEDYYIIKFAIKNHNKYQIPDCNDERMFRHANLIRDIDKMDILYYLGYLGEHNYKASLYKLSVEVIDDVKKHKLVDREHICNNNDSLAVHFAFAFDIYNDICLEKVKRNLGYFYKQIDGDDIFREIYDEVINYIDERIDNNVREEI